MRMKSVTLSNPEDMHTFNNLARSVLMRQRISSEIKRKLKRIYMSGQYYVVAATSELEEGGQMHVDLNGEEILLCKHGGEFFAISYYCSHEEFTLEGGELHDGCITCPYHGAEFALADGSVQASPAYEPIKTYALRIDNDTIAILV